MKAASSVSMPFGSVTVTSTVPGAWAAVTTMSVVESTNVTEVVGVPPKSTVVAAVNPKPVKVTVSPPRGDPLVGLTDVTAGRTLKV